MNRKAAAPRDDGRESVRGAAQQQAGNRGAVDNQRRAPDNEDALWMLTQGWTGSFDKLEAYLPAQ